jgi:hypothetical protein
MHKLVFVLGAAAGFVAGCGNGGTSPVAYCEHFEAELCTRVFECADSTTRASDEFQTQYGASPIDCGARFTANYCATVTADHPCASSSMGYHADKADACVADLKAAACSTIENGFTSDNCSAVCS